MELDGRHQMRHKEKLKNKVSIAAIIIIIMIGVTNVTGCKPEEKESKKDIMMAYMEQKYKETFTFVNIGTELWDKQYTEMYVTSDNLPGKSICVLLYDKKDESGNRIFEDNYIFHLRQQEINDYLSKLAEPIYGPNMMFSIVVLLPGDATPEMPIEELIKRIKHQGNYYLRVCKDVETKDEDAEQFRATLEANGTAISMYIAYLRDPSIFDELDEAGQIRNWEIGKTVLNGRFVMDRNYQLYDGKVDWRNK
jgi:hypothetical protein